MAGRSAGSARRTGKVPTASIRYENASVSEVPVRQLRLADFRESKPWRDVRSVIGRTGDLEAEWTEEAIQWITTENTTLKRRVRQLTADIRTLDERLKASRSNLRFQDRRVADLEARIADPASTT